jgi:hypothetical protein
MFLQYLNLITAIVHTRFAFPHIADYIRIQLQVPQAGPYHKEGDYLESHLTLSLKVLSDLAHGSSYPYSDPMNKANLIIASTVSTKKAKLVNDNIVYYLMLHDIGKVDRLSILVEGSERKQQIDWESWCRYGKKQANGDFTFYGKKVTCISYFHPKEEVLASHGSHGASLIDNGELSKEARDIVQVIKMHESGFSFDRINAGQFDRIIQKHNLTEKQIKLFLTVTYIDAAASKQENGIEMEKFHFLADSYLNLLDIQRFRSENLVGFKEIEPDLLKYRSRLNGQIPEEFSLAT